MACHTIFQGIFPTQGSNSDLPQCRQILYLQWPNLLDPHNYIISLWHGTLMTETLPEILWFETLSQFFASWLTGVFCLFVCLFLGGNPGLVACHSKANKEATLVERKVCFIMDAGIWGKVGVGWTLSKDWLLHFTPSNQGARTFIDREKGLHAETIQSALTIILKLVISGLTIIILIVSGTINLQFQGQFVSISWDKFSELWQHMSWLRSGHHVVNFFWWEFQDLYDN